MFISHRVMRGTILLIGITFMGCSQKLAVEPYSFPKEFQSDSEVFYKGHLVKEYKKYSSDTDRTILKCNDKCKFRYFGYKDANDKIIYHGLYEAYDDNGKTRAEILYTEGMPDGLSIIRDENGNVEEQGIYKKGHPWDGRFILISDSVFTFKDGKNIAFEDKETGKVYARGEWENDKKWNGSFCNWEDGKFEYYNDGKLVNRKSIEDVVNSAK